MNNLALVRRVTLIAHVRSFMKWLIAKVHKPQMSICDGMLPISQRYILVLERLLLKCVAEKNTWHNNVRCPIHDFAFATTNIFLGQLLSVSHSETLWSSESYSVTVLSGGSNSRLLSNLLRSQHV